MSDSGLSALRSVLDIPVIGPAKASYFVAFMLGGRFSVLTQWDPRMIEKALKEMDIDYELAPGLPGLASATRWSRIRGRRSTGDRVR
jgi:Asp/Glu/hydantoin racemase